MKCCFRLKKDFQYLQAEEDEVDDEDFSKELEKSEKLIALQYNDTDRKLAALHDKYAQELALFEDNEEAKKILMSRFEQEQNDILQESFEKKMQAYKNAFQFNSINIIWICSNCFS